MPCPAAHRPVAVGHRPCHARRRALAIPDGGGLAALCVRPRRSAAVCNALSLVKPVSGWRHRHDSPRPPFPRARARHVRLPPLAPQRRAGGARGNVSWALGLAARLCGAEGRGRQRGGAVHERALCRNVARHALTKLTPGELRNCRTLAEQLASSYSISRNAPHIRPNFADVGQN